MAQITDPYLASFFPDEEKLLPAYNVTKDLWVVSNSLTPNNTFFRTQWVECQYPISGGYALIPRIVFYCLVVISIIGRGKKWAVSAALGGVMIYSSTAAIHALVLAGMRFQLAPGWLFPNYQVVLAEGQAVDGEWSQGDTSQRNAPLWLPVIPMVWDLDCDAVLLITGVAFLLLLPMYVWSDTLRHYLEYPENASAEECKSVLEHRIIIYSWGAILFAGLIAALINQAYVFFWSFPQLRFCPLDREDKFPVHNDGTPPIEGKWDRQDWYLWNRTVYNYFVLQDPGIQPTNICLYTCFDRTWPLRDPEDIQVVEGTVGALFETNGMFKFQIAVYVLVGCSAAGCLTLALLKAVPRIPESWRNFKLQASWQDTIGEFKNGRRAGLSAMNPRNFTRLRDVFPKTGRLLMRIWVLFVVLYSFVLSPVALIAFLVYFEWQIANADPGTESPIHVGQWSVAVGATLAFIAAVFPAVAIRFGLIGRRLKSVQSSSP